MISPDRRLLQQQIYNFLRSVTIKFTPMADYLNATLVQQGHLVNIEDPASWKYYLNMVGQYHPSDTPMQVLSLDTRETIILSPTVLIDHPRTKTAYLPGGPYYNRLCALYPDQVDLIKSILFPVSSMTEALAADDLTLLSFGSGYLETYEEPVLVMEVEKFLSILKERWYFDFLDDEPYFHLTFWASVPVYLAMLLMTARLGNLHTAFVHSWDIWAALEGEGIDNYSDILDRKKSMMLYQNIDYLRANAGKQSNLVILAERLLRDLGIGLYARIIVEEAETGASQYQLTPQLVPVEIQLGQGGVPAQITTKRVDEIQAELYTKGLTPSHSAETILSVERQLGDTNLNQFTTKLLEIRPIAQIKPYAETLNGFLLETLLVSVTQGYYTKPVEVTDPLTNQPIYLSPLELLALYHYAIHQSMGIVTDSFPTQIHLYRAFLPVIGTPALTIEHFGYKLYLSQQVNAGEYLSGLSYTQNLQSPGEFSANATALWLRFMDHMIQDQSTVLDKRSHLYQYLTSLCHQRMSKEVTFVQGYSGYTQWLGAGGIDIQGTILTQYAIQNDPRIQWGNLADAIMTALIPPTDTLKLFGNFTLSDAGYARLRQLFIQMCSYKVVFLESDRDTAEFVNSAKWSHEYGPSHVMSYGELITEIKMQGVNTTHQTLSRELQPGVMETDVTSAVTRQHHLENTTMVLGAVTSLQDAELAMTTMAIPSVHSTQGRLLLRRSGALQIVS